jgi:N-acetyl-alpha-D-muramate 1-phosphate uridylyltransferase
MQTLKPPATALLLAAGRGERMRPLTDATPKPLLQVRGKPLIVWHIEALARHSIHHVVINTAWLGEQFAATLGDGSRYGVHISYSHEGAALETAGAIAQARHLLDAKQSGAPFWVISADIFAPDFAFGTPGTQRFLQSPELLAHLFMVPNPPFHLNGDYAIDPAGMLSNAPEKRLTFGNFGLYRLPLVADVAAGTRAKLAPYFTQGAQAGRISAELYSGPWHNVGTPAQLAALNV